LHAAFVDQLSGEAGCADQGDRTTAKEAGEKIKPVVGIPAN
jgi:hypothetical protein